MNRNLDISKIILKRKDEFIFNLLGIDCFENNASPFRHYYNFIKKNGKKLEGDIFEFGVFKGKTLLAQAILLKKYKINKKIYGFDNFKGFPNYHEYDSFKYLNQDKKLYLNHLISKKIRKFIINKAINEKNISQSLDFSIQSKKELIRKIKFLKLDNIILVEGNFLETVPDFFKNYKKKIFSVNLDSDLYESYKTILPIVYPKLVRNGYIHLDEYYSIKFPGAYIACSQFAKENNIKIRINKTFDGEFKRYCIIK